MSPNNNHTSHLKIHETYESHKLENSTHVKQNWSVVDETAHIYTLTQNQTLKSS
jgi:hypothetical protein